jgi:hypothetical protein
VHLQPLLSEEGYALLLCEPMGFHQRRVGKLRPIFLANLLGGLPVKHERKQYLGQKEILLL